MLPIDLLNCREIADAAGVNHATAVRHARAGRFGAPVVREGGKHAKYSLAAVERAYGKQFKPAQTEAAAKNTRSQGAIIGDFCHLIIELSNRRWIDMLAKRGITGIDPPNPKDY
jgi:hypothetical protein